MSSLCATCGQQLTEGRCARCSGAPPAAYVSTDPLVGRLIADRYQVVGLLSDGGMARLYAAVQQSLDRPVAIKTIHPDLLGSDPLIAEELVRRFMLEAHAASMINHPNVINIYDFGRMAPEDGGHLFQVMELLSGRDLFQVINDREPMPPVRIVSIMRQMLAALSEAHHLGITHRDIKPENILVETRRNGLDHVKVIDFGVAKLAGESSSTRKGRIVGSALYTAPEQARGDEAAPSADLYSAGVVLFELLTGRVPFDAGSLVETWKLHISAPRPDPRDFAPDRAVLDELALVCLRAMAIDPAERYPDAAAFSQALLDAGVAAGLLMPLSVTDRPSVAPPGGAGAFRAALEGRPASVPPRGNVSISTAPAPLLAPAELPPPRVAVLGPYEVPLVGRRQELRWVEERIARGTAAAAIFGPPGVGKTRVLREAVAGAQHAILVTAPPYPCSEVGYSAAAAVISALVGVAPSDPALRAGQASDDPWIRGGLRIVFSSAAVKSSVEPEAMRRAVCAALRWAAERAISRAAPGPAVVAIDDLGAVDRASRLALRDLLADPPAGMVMLLAAELLPDDLGDWPARELMPLPSDEAQELVRRLRGDAQALSVAMAQKDMEPLRGQLLVRWRAGDGASGAAQQLDRLVEWKVRSLPPAARQALQAVALLGRATAAQLARLVPRGDELGGAVASLVDTGLCRREDENAMASTEPTWMVAHALFADVALALAPTGALAQMHARAAAALAEAPTELLSHHAIRGEPDFSAFMLVEQSARLRSQRGDLDGAIAVLAASMRAARTLLLRGEVEAAASALSTFGHKLATALLSAGRTDDARGVLQELAARLAPDDPARQRAADELARLDASHPGG